MLKYLTLASLILLTGCGPRNCVLGVRNPYYSGDSRAYDSPAYKAAAAAAPGGDAADANGAGGAAFAPQSSLVPPMTVASADTAPAPKQAHPSTSRTNAPMALASRTTSSPIRPKQYTGPAKYDADGYDPYLGDADVADDRDYVRPRTAGRDRIREDYRPRRPDYVTRREDHREPKYRAERFAREPRRDHGRYGDAPRKYGDHGKYGDGPGKYGVGHGKYGNGQGKYGGDRERPARDRGSVSGDDGRRGRSHVNRYDGAEMASSDHRRGGNGRRARRDDAGDGERRRDRRERRHGRDDMG